NHQLMIDPYRGLLIDRPEMQEYPRTPPVLRNPEGPAVPHVSILPVHPRQERFRWIRHQDLFPPVHRSGAGTGEIVPPAVEALPARTPQSGTRILRQGAIRIDVI